MAAIIAGGGNRKLAGERVIWIDTITSFSPSYTNSVSSHPIEKGATVSDHVSKVNTKLSITGVIGGHSYLEFPDNEIPNVTTARAISPGVYLPANPRVQAAYDTLVALQEKRSPITIISELDRYDNCIITSLSFPTIGEVLEVSIELEQVRYATIQSVVKAVQVIPQKQDDATAKTTSNGASTTNGSTQEAKTMIDKLTNWIGVPEMGKALKEAVQEIANTERGK